MSNIDMIRDLRAITQAGMKDCRQALEESHWDLDKAVDIIKTKGKLIASGSKIAAEGIVAISTINNSKVMVEVNCVTDFVARMPEFNKFVDVCLDSLCQSVSKNETWDCNSVDAERKNLVSITKENIVVRRWWIEQMFKEEAHLFSYVHSNEKIGVILSMLAPSVEANKSDEFIALGNNLVLQIASMKPLAVSPDKLDSNILERQKAIFDQQIKDLNKPAAAHDKIMEGKLNKWYTEVCLLDQYYVLHDVFGSKITVGQAIKNACLKIGGDVQIVNFIRCEVGEGIDKPKDDFANEALKMTGCFK